MMKKFACTAACIFGMIVGTAPATVMAAPDAALYDGIWGGGLRKGREEISFKVTMLAGHGVMEFKTGGWGELTAALCEYVFTYKGNTISDTHLNGSKGHPDRCPSTMPFVMNRTADDSLTLNFPQLASLPEINLSAGLRPLRSQERRAEIANLDILGIKTGMRQDDIERLLEKAGYKLNIEYTLVSESTGGFKQETRYYMRAIEGATGEDDTFIVSYAAGDAPKAMLVARQWKMAANTQITALTLKNAVLEKYGPAKSSEERLYTRKGENLIGFGKTNNCPEGSLQTLPYRIAYRGLQYNGQANLYCGASVAISVGSNSQTGLASSLNVAIVDNDEIWENFWTIWSYNESEKTKTLYNSIANAKAAAPKL